MHRLSKLLLHHLTRVCNSFPMIHDSLYIADIHTVETTAIGPYLIGAQTDTGPSTGLSKLGL